MDLSPFDVLAFAPEGLAIGIQAVRHAREVAQWRIGIENLMLVRHALTICLEWCGELARQ
jgi:hypothetical protein